MDYRFAVSHMQPRRLADEEVVGYVKYSYFVSLALQAIAKGSANETKTTSNQNKHQKLHSQLDGASLTPTRSY